jgi:hypothetical protein
LLLLWATHFTGHHHRSDVGRLRQCIQNNPFLKTIVEKSETAEANIPSQTKSHGTAFLFPN